MNIIDTVKFIPPLTVFSYSYKILDQILKPLHDISDKIFIDIFPEYVGKNYEPYLKTGKIGVDTIFIAGNLSLSGYLAYQTYSYIDIKSLFGFNSVISTLTNIASELQDRSLENLDIVVGFLSSITLNTPDYIDAMTDLFPQQDLESTLDNFANRLFVNLYGMIDPIFAKLIAADSLGLGSEFQSIAAS